MVSYLKQFTDLRDFSSLLLGLARTCCLICQLVVLVAETATLLLEYLRPLRQQPSPLFGGPVACGAAAYSGVFYLFERVWCALRWRRATCLWAGFRSVS